MDCKILIKSSIVFGPSMVIGGAAGSIHRYGCSHVRIFAWDDYSPRGLVPICISNL
jgi:hypothetical protein